MANGTQSGLDLSRQAIMINGKRASEIALLIIGAGGVGSNAAYVAASIGVGNITVYDHDTVGEENCAPQFFKPSQVGMKKVDALAENVLGFTGLEIEPRDKKFYGQKGFYDIVLVGVDSMRDRRKIWKSNGLTYSFWLDARMGGTTCSLLALRPEVQKHIIDYEKEFLTWEDKPLACGTKATAYITKGILVGKIGEAIATIINADKVERIPYWQVWDSSGMVGTTIP